MFFLIALTKVNNNWSFEPYPNYYLLKHKTLGNIINKNYDWYDLFIYLKIDNKETQITGMNSGYYEKDKISINITSKPRIKSDYINIFHHITNNDTVSHSICLATSMHVFLAGSKLAGMSNIEGMRGIYARNFRDSIFFFLRNSFDVTDVDTYNYDGQDNIYNGYDRWKNRTDWSYKNQQWYSRLSFSWQNMVLPPGESIDLVYAVGTGSYKNDSPITIKAPNDAYFTPSSMININISVDSYDEFSQVSIFRLIDDNESILYKNYTDCLTGKDTNDFIDEFQLSKIGGVHNITYIMKLNDTQIASKSFEVLIDEAPRIRTNVELKRQFSVGEEVSIDVEAFDDAVLLLVCYNDNSRVYSQYKICNGDINRSVITFKIPNNPANTDHNITIFGIDQYNIISNKYEFQYKVVAYKSPDLEVRTKLKTFYKEKEVINVLGRIRDMDGSGEVYIYSSINSTNITSYGREHIKDTSWIDVTFRVRVMSSFDTVNTLRLYCIDNQQGISNTFVHTFSVIPENFGNCDNTDYVTQGTASIYASLIYWAI